MASAALQVTQCDLHCCCFAACGWIWLGIYSLGRLQFRAVDFGSGLYYIILYIHNIQYTICDIQYTISNMQYATYNMKGTTGEGRGVCVRREGIRLIVNIEKLLLKCRPGYNISGVR